MKRTCSLAIVSLQLLINAFSSDAAVSYKIVTASERGTYIQIGRDVADIVAPQANIDLEVLPSAGSAENVRRLRYEPGVKFALVQSDVYQAFLDLAASGNTEAGTIIRPLRVILPLYNEEIHFIVRTDSKLNYIHEIKNARINAGPRGSGTALTTSTLYRLMFGEQLPDQTTTYLTNEDALVQLISGDTLDVVAVIAGQPAKLFVDMKPEAGQLIRFLRLDPGQPASRAALRTYFPATLRASNYPSLLSEDIPSLAVKAFLVTYDYRTTDTQGYFTQFAKALCDNFPRLQSQGHPKWREVELELPDLGRGWSYYPPTMRALQTCAAAHARSRVVGGKACTQQERILGFC